MSRNRVPRILSILATGSLLLAVTVHPTEQQPLQVLIAVPAPFSLMVEQGFHNNLPDPLLADGRFTSPPGGVESTFAAADTLQAAAYDLVVLSRSFISDRSFPRVLQPLLRDLTEQRLALIDAGHIYVVAASYPDFESQVIGAELPWDSNFVIAITVDTDRFEEAFAFLQDIAQNILHLQIAGEPVSVKAHNLTNNTRENVYGVHLEYDKAPEDADAEDNRAWECKVEGNDAICTTAVGLAPEKRLAVGVAFRDEEPGELQECWWSKKSGPEAGGC